MDAFLRKLAATPHTILITGRTGTGKSFLAREIHDFSPRCNGRFVTINLATLSENLIESELFGHEKGAFSGADTRRVGKLESANGGTAFLDEIGELPLRLQTKLLEALNSHVISPVGSNREIGLNIRIVAATNRDLRKMVSRGEFREDLYFRLNTFQIELPSLASMPERIGPLAEKFVAEAAGRLGKAVPAIGEDLREAIGRLPWPGNVRELRNCLEYAVAMSGPGPLNLQSLPPYLLSLDPHTELIPGGLDSGFPSDYRQAKRIFEKTYLRELLRRNQGKINRTARETGLSKVTLIEKIRRYEIDVGSIKLKTVNREQA